MHAPDPAPVGGSAASATPDLGYFRRFGRQIIVPRIGLTGQRKLGEAKVLVVGLGGLGSASAMALAAAGIGELHLIDPDRVEESNLHRQLLYSLDDVGRPKAEAARDRLAARDPRTRIVAEVGTFEPDGAVRRAADVDVVVDASDNFPTRYLVSDACVRVGRPDVFAAVQRLEGQVATFDSRSGPCYRCLFPEPPPADAAPGCGEGGVLGILPVLLGTLQAAEVVRSILGWAEPGVSKLLLVDAENLETRELLLRRRADCDGCAPALRRPDAPLVSNGWAVATGLPTGFDFIEPQTLRAELAEPQPPTLLDVRSANEREVVALAGSRWIPLEELPGRISEMSDARRPVVYCQWGGRSERAGRLLAESGLRPIRVLRGGLDAYAVEADPSLPRL